MKQSTLTTALFTFIVTLLFLINPAFGDDLVIDPNGNVGIGTISPNGKLDVEVTTTRIGMPSNLNLENDIALTNIDTTTDTGVLSIGFRHKTSAAWADAAIASFSMSPGNSRLGFYTENENVNAERLTILNNGNVGIGTTEPADKLHIFGAIRVGPDAINYARISGTAGNLYLLPIDTSGTVNIYKGGGPSAEAARLRIYDGSAYNLVLDGNGDCYFNTGGNFGIGTTVPSNAKFVVDHNGPDVAYFKGSANPTIFLRENGSGANSFIGYFIFQAQDSNGNDTNYASIKGLRGVTTDGSETGQLRLGTCDTPNAIVIRNGNTGIDRTSPSEKLDVNGTIKAAGLNLPCGDIWCDFVFEENYQLKPIEQVESFIKENKHLPDIPSAQELKETGISVTDMLSKQMQKIEELTLYLVDQNKELEALKRKNKELEARLAMVERDK